MPILVTDAGIYDPNQMPVLEDASPKTFPGSLWCVANTLTRTDVRNWACLSPSPSTSETERRELAINRRIIRAAMTTIESAEEPYSRFYLRILR